MLRRVSILAVTCCALFGQTEGEAIFSKHVRPMLLQKCEACHGPAQQISNLSASTRDGLLKGGVRGTALVPGKPAESLLLTAIEHAGALKMPPGQKLDEATIAAVRRWIEVGAPWMEGESAQNVQASAASEDTWAFQALKKTAPPAGGNPIDAFLDAKLASAKVAPLPPADRRTLIRRATYDLWGIPPSPGEVDAFVKEPGPDEAAFAKLIDRLLASPHYGARWGRHWLDVVRYADTGGFSNDFERPNAWRYRDYVIRAFQQNKPFDRFLMEQIAGDEMDPSDPEKLVATGFLRMGPWEHTGMSVAAITRQEWLDDVTHTTAASFLGITMECARCHDHKFDPIPTKDYYRLQAVFSATEFADRPAPFLDSEKRPEFDAGRARLAAQLKRAEDKMASYGDRKQLPPEEFERFKIWQKRVELYKRSAKRYDPIAYSVSNGPWEEKDREKWTPPETFILPVGNLQTPGEKVTPGIVSAVWRGEGKPAMPLDVGGRRLALARWMTTDNPLVARVIVNRIWHWHFGRGIVATPNDFGKLGKRPTHPELLDWMAATFVEEDWDIRAMHRRIMMSAAYRRASKAEDDKGLYGWFQPRRLEAEEIRDSMLAASGALSTDGGGPGTFPEINEDVAAQPVQIMGTLMPAYQPSPELRARNRRTVYAFQKRALVDPMLEVMNAPSLNESTPRREASTIPTQAFALLNGVFPAARALDLAARVPEASALDDLFRAVLQRLPSKAERDAAATHLARRLEYHSRTPAAAKPARKPLVRGITSELTGAEVLVEEEPAPPDYEEGLRAADVEPRVRALADVALVLFNSNEFLYVY